MRKKQFYEAPEAEVLKVKFERNFCESPLEGNENLNNPQDYHGMDSWR